MNPSYREILNPCHYFELKKAQLTPLTFHRSVGIRSPFRPTAETAHNLISSQYYLTQDSINYESFQPDKELAVGFNIAREATNQLRTSLGLAEVPVGDMKIQLLDIDKLAAIYESLSGKKNKLLGLQSNILPSVLVGYDYLNPSDFTASLAYHELIHRWLEISVGAMYVKSVFPDFQMFYEHRRNGLSTYKVVKEDQEYRYRYPGKVLNELGNFWLQGKFLDRDKLHGDSPDGVVETVEGNSYFYDSSLLLYDKNGASLHRKYPRPFWYMQLAQDLNTLCSEDDVSFGETLVRAKVEPSLQNKLRKLVDSKLGTGFFKRMKYDTTEGQVPSLLMEVQRYIY